MDSSDSSSPADYSARGVYVSSALEARAVCDEPEDFAIHNHRAYGAFGSVVEDPEYIKAGDVRALQFMGNVTLENEKEFRKARQKLGKSRLPKGSQNRAFRA